MDIFNENTAIRLMIIVYSALVFFSFFIFIGVAKLKDEHDNFGIKCPLYGELSDPGPESNCNFPMAISIIFQLLYTLYRIVTLLLLMMGKFTADFVLFSDMFELIHLAIDIIGGFLFTFIGACILSAGYNEFCDALKSVTGLSCSDTDSAANVAQAGAWISTILWLALGVYTFMFLWRNGKLPFLGGGGGGASEGAPGTTGPATNPPNMETPSQNPDELRY